MFLFVLTLLLQSIQAPGALVVVENPPQILRYLDGAKQTVPVLDLSEPVKLVTMKPNKIQKIMPVNVNSESQHGFWLMGTNAKLINIHVIKTGCPGLMCDAIDTNHKWCPCYSKSDPHAQIVICMRIKIVPGLADGGTFTVHNLQAKFSLACA